MCSKHSWLVAVKAAPINFCPKILPMSFLLLAPAALTFTFPLDRIFRRRRWAGGTRPLNGCFCVHAEQCPLRLIRDPQWSRFLKFVFRCASMVTEKDEELSGEGHRLNQWQSGPFLIIIIGAWMWPLPQLQSTRFIVRRGMSKAQYGCGVGQ